MRLLFRMLATAGCGVDDRHAGRDGGPLQVAALPFSVDRADGLRFLLITSRSSGRWIIPKGWPVKGLTLGESAAREAYEEAGVRGTVGAAEVGRLAISKKPRPDMPARTWPAIVYPLRVRTSLARWPEQSQRHRRWVTRAEAMELAPADIGQIILASDDAALARSC